MTGMFARLAARVAGLEGAPVGALRPRLPSRFEEGSAASDADGVDLGDGGFPEVAVPLPPSRQRLRLGADDAPAIGPEPGGAPLGAAAGWATGPPEPPAAPASGASVAPSPPPSPADRARPGVPKGVGPAFADSAPSRPVAPSGRGAAEGDTAESATAEGGTAAERGPAAVGRRAQSVPEPRPRHPTRRVPAADAPVGRSSGPPPMQSHDRAVPSPIHTDRPVTPPPAIRPVLPAAPATAPPTVRRDGPTATQPPTAPPVVHVTIGRVELRGVTGAASRRVERRPEPAVSTLDAYLRRRARQA